MTYPSSSQCDGLIKTREKRLGDSGSILMSISADDRGNRSHGRGSDGSSRLLFGRSRSGAAPRTSGRRGPTRRRIVLRTGAGLAGGREIGGDLLRDLAGGRPFRPALVGGDRSEEHPSELPSPCN